MIWLLSDLLKNKQIIIYFAYSPHNNPEAGPTQKNFFLFWRYFCNSPKSLKLILQSSDIPFIQVTLMLMSYIITEFKTSHSELRN